MNGAARIRVRPLIVVALGGNALLRRGERPDAEVQRRNVAVGVTALAKLASEYDLVVTHGNGPQVGLLALQAMAGPSVPFPLDVLGAESEGLIGYLLEQGLRNALPGRDVATLLTQVIVDPSDTAFTHPTKPIGPVYDEAEARRLSVERNWAVAPDGNRFRRVVPSPRPCDIVELNTIRLLLASNVIVVCAGGGGIPVVVDADGALRGVEAVIDKDLASALLAERLGADGLLILTDVDGVQLDFGTDSAHRITRAGVAELRAMPFAPGSMGPKVEAACAFVEHTRGISGIGRLDDAREILRGSAGTLVVADLAATSRR